MNTKYTQITKTPALYKGSKSGNIYLLNSEGDHITVVFLGIKNNDIYKLGEYDFFPGRVGNTLLNEHESVTLSN